MADAWKAEHFGLVGGEAGQAGEVEEDVVEREFWRVIAGGAAGAAGDEGGRSVLGGGGSG